MAEADSSKKQPRRRRSTWRGAERLRPPAEAATEPTPEPVEPTPEPVEPPLEAVEPPLEAVESTPEPAAAPTPEPTPEPAAAPTPEAAVEPTPEPAIEPTPEADEPTVVAETPEQLEERRLRRARRRRLSLWPWLTLLVAALLGIAAGTWLGLRSTSLFPSQTPEARPTIVVARPASPSAISPAASASPTTSPSSQAQTPGQAEASEYVVQPGDTMRSIAQQVYGDAELWPRIYDANRDIIGQNPDDLKVGMHLRIPPR